MKNERKRELKFTKRAIAGLEAGETRSYWYDTLQDNLAVCVTVAGSKTFYRCGRVGGKAVRVRLGKFPDMSVEQARNLARAVAGDLARNIDPRHKKQAGTTLQDLFDHWLAHAKQRKKTWQEDARKWDMYFAGLRDKRLADVTTTIVSRWHSTLGEKHGPYLANRTRALLSAMYGVAHELGYKGENPCSHVKPFPEESRERFLRPEEMRPFFQALTEEPPEWRDFWLLCLFSGARRGNVAGMAWADVDLSQGIWYLPGQVTKNGLPIAVVLPPPAIAILRVRHDVANGSPWVFSADTASGHIVDPRKSWARVVKAAGIENLRPHDLRRSLGSWQALAGASLQIIGASLGHKDLKSTAVYSRLLLDPVRSSVNGAVGAMLEAGGLQVEPEGGN